MSKSFKLHELHEVIEALNAKKESHRGILIDFLLGHYQKEEDIANVKKIEANDIVNVIFAPAPTDAAKYEEFLKTFKKKYTSQKSSLNTTFRDLFRKGLNPKRIGITRENTFGYLPESKDEIIKKLSLTLDVLSLKFLDPKKKGSPGELDVGKLVDKIKSITDLEKEAEEFKENLIKEVEAEISEGESDRKIKVRGVGADSIEVLKEMGVTITEEEGEEKGREKGDEGKARGRLEGDQGEEKGKVGDTGREEGFTEKKEKAKKIGDEGKEKGREEGEEGRKKGREEGDEDTEKGRTEGDEGKEKGKEEEGAGQERKKGREIGDEGKEKGKKEGDKGKEEGKIGETGEEEGLKEEKEKEKKVGEEEEKKRKAESDEGEFDDVPPPAVAGGAKEAHGEGGEFEEAGAEGGEGSGGAGEVIKPLARMVLIPKGPFVSGCNTDDIAFRPERTRELDEFMIGQFPVTNYQFSKFVAKTGYITEAEIENVSWVFSGMVWNKVIEMDEDGFEEERIVFEKGNLLEVEGANWKHPSGPLSSIEMRMDNPVVHLTLKDVLEFIQWRSNATGKPFRLPTEYEWEKAARGAEGNIYPWGNDWSPEKCNSYESRTNGLVDVDLHKAESPYEVYDLIGNVWEWTLGTEVPLTLEEARQKLTVRDRKDFPVLKGGSWMSSKANLTAYCKVKYQPTMRSNFIGFRCARESDAKAP